MLIFITLFQWGAMAKNSRVADRVCVDMRTYVRSSCMKTPNVCTSLCWHGYCFAGKRVQ